MKNIEYPIFKARAVYKEICSCNPKQCSDHVDNIKKLSFKNYFLFDGMTIFTETSNEKNLQHTPKS